MCGRLATTAHKHVRLRVILHINTKNNNKKIQKKKVGGDKLKKKEGRSAKFYLKARKFRFFA